MAHTYLDYNATTPLDPRVRLALEAVLDSAVGNPSSPHAPGRAARAIVDRARRHIAQALRVQTDELIFTSGATEANNLALRGLVSARQARGRHLITSAIEHPSVLQVCRALERDGFRVTYVPVPRDGVVEAAAIAGAITPETSVIALMAVNNELGTIQPVQAVGALARSRDIAFHVDAVQALGKWPVDLAAWQADTAALSAHKAYGPQGIGVLFRRRGVTLQPLMAGGHQESDLRPGTESVALIAGCGAAIALAVEEQPNESARLARLQESFLTELRQHLDGWTLNGHATQRVPSTVNVTFDGVDGPTLVQCLDLDGMAVATGAACSSGRMEPSHVLLALGRTIADAKASIRISLGRQTTEAQLQALAAALARHVPRLRTSSAIAVGT